MLALTQNAADAVEAIVHQDEAPEGAVLRITTAESDEAAEEASRQLQLTVAATPEEDDLQVAGYAISIEPETIPFLDDKVLDAEFAGGGVEFKLYLQPPGLSEQRSPNGKPPT